MTTQRPLFLPDHRNKETARRDPPPPPAREGNWERERDAPIREEHAEAEAECAEQQHPPPRGGPPVHRAALPLHHHRRQPSSSAPPPPPGSWPPPNRRNQKKKKNLTTNKTKNKKLPPLARQGPNPRGDREEEQGGVRDWRWADRRRGRGEMRRRRRKQLLVLLWFAWLRRLKQTKLWSAWWPPPCFCLSFFLTAFKNYYSLLTFQFPFPLFLFFFFCFCLSPFELCCW